jgi:hypothetical protein
MDGAAASPSEHFWLGAAVCEEHIMAALLHQTVLGPSKQVETGRNMSKHVETASFDLSKK